MAEDDQNRARESDAEHEAEIAAELERVDEDPDEAGEGRQSLGKQNAESGSPRDADADDEDVIPGEHGVEDEEAEQAEADDEERAEDEREEQPADASD